MNSTVITTVVLAFFILLFVIVAMSIGVMNGRKAISGSCGGLNGGRCEICTGKCRKGKDQ